MALSACGEILLTSLQNVFSTSVGVGFAYPILSQIIDIKNEKILKECDRIMRMKKNDKMELMHLGVQKNVYQFKINGISRLSGLLTSFSAVIGVCSFFLLVFSSVNPNLCVSESTSFILCIALSIPFALGVFQLLRWYDAYMQFQAAVAYCRGDHKWSGKKYRL